MAFANIFPFAPQRDLMQILIGGKKLANWTSAELAREKKNLTGTLSVNIFLPKIPDKPIETTIIQGQPAQVLIAGQCVFTGILDKRRGRARARARAAPDSSAELRSSIGAGGYKIELLARGRCKALIDSSHRHKTGTFRKTTDKKVIEALAAPHKIDVEWQAQELPLERAVLRDGALVMEEIFRLCNENCHFAYETAEGKLRITDEPAARGGKIALGYNIMEFSAEQSEQEINSEIVVKGHKAKRGIWGKDAVVDTLIRVQDGWVGNYSPLVVQHYGEASAAALKRRAKWEADKRTAQSKQISVTVFSAADETGAPWDIGKLYNLAIAPEGIAGDFECIALSYKADASGEISTEMKFAPPPSPKSGGIAGKAPPAGKRSFGSFNAWPKNWGCADLRQLPANAQELPGSLSAPRLTGDSDVLQQLREMRQNGQINRSYGTLKIE